jgi:hypothetical protein
LLSFIGMLWAPRYFFEPRIYFGCLSAPYLAGLIFILIWLIAYLVYFFRYWPYRD